MQGAVPEEAKTAGVCRDVAADLARALGAEIERHGESPLGEVGVQVFQDAARLCGHGSKERWEGGGGT